MSGGNADRLTLLAVFAHPDDETFATGGTLARYGREGVRTVIACATRGERGQTGDPPLVEQAGLGAVREQELRCAARALGVDEVVFLDCVDGELSTCGRQTVIEKIVRVMRRVRPQVVVTFGADGVSRHPDHRAISGLATDAFLSASSPAAYLEHAAQGLAPFSPQKLYFVAVPRSFVVGRGLPAFGVQDQLITTTIDISAYLEQKTAAGNCHRTQAKDFARLQERLGGSFPPQETFRLAVSRLGPIEVREDDFFAGLC